MSLSFRQTGVVWVVFVAGTVAVRNAESAVKEKAGKAGKMVQLMTHVLWLMSVDTLTHH